MTEEKNIPDVTDTNDMSDAPDMPPVMMEENSCETAEEAEPLPSPETTDPPIADEGSDLTPTGREEEEEEEEKTSPVPDGEEMTVEQLRAEISTLREELAQVQTLHARMESELSEFYELFPEVSTASLPDSIWDQVKQGIPLAASYALYEKKCAAAKARAETVNLLNAQKTPGAAGKNTVPEYFTPDDVRAMSRAEVHNHYQKIMNSMKKWNF